MLGGMPKSGQMLSRKESRVLLAGKVVLEGHIAEVVLGSGDYQ